MSIPYITKATESALAQVPTWYREGAEALGLPVGWTLRKIVLKTATPGIVTGHAGGARDGDRRDGADAVHGGLDGFPADLQLTHSPVGYLTYPIWTF